LASAQVKRIDNSGDPAQTRGKGEDASDPTGDFELFNKRFEEGSGSRIFLLLF
jgi:hypothetical protein